MTTSSPPNRIKEWRNRRRLSLAELGDAVGLSRSEINKLESGARRVRADHLVVLARALRVQPEDLMDQKMAREMMGRSGDQAGAGDRAPSLPPPDLPVLIARRRSDGLFLEAPASESRIPRPAPLLGIDGAYAFHMPDMALEPRVPIGALLYVNPLLPARPGDLGVLRYADGGQRVVAVDRAGSGLVANDGLAQVPVDPLDPAILRIERITGLWFN